MCRLDQLEALKYCLEKDVAIILFFNGISCAGLYAVVRPPSIPCRPRTDSDSRPNQLPTISEVMEQTYGLSTSLTGLC